MRHLGYSTWPLLCRARCSEEILMPTATEVIVVEQAACSVCHCVGEGCDSTTCHGLDTD